MASPGVIIIDIETTGFNSKTDSIIEIYAIRYWRGSIQEEFSTLIKPKKPLPQKIIELTGIQEEDLVDAPRFEQIKDDLYKFMKNKRIISYNSSFEKRFLTANDRRFSCLRYVDYLNFMKRKRPNLKSYSLEAVGRYFGFINKQQHRAKEDVEILLRLVKLFGS